MHSLAFASPAIARSPLIQLGGLEQCELSSLLKETTQQLSIKLVTSQSAIQCSNRVCVRACVCVCEDTALKHIFTYSVLGYILDKRNGGVFHKIKQHILLMIFVLLQKVFYSVHHYSCIMFNAKLHTPSSLICSLDVIRVPTKLMMLLLQKAFVTTLWNIVNR